jgi:hypothetical protein
MDSDSLSISVAPSLIGDLDPYLKTMYQIEQENNLKVTSTSAGGGAQQRQIAKLQHRPSLNDCLRRAYSCQSNLLKALLLIERNFYDSLLPRSKNLYNLLT